jgi:hypothetical protein
MIPLAVVPGRTTQAAFDGEHLTGATKLWTSCRAEAKRIAAETVAFDLTMPANASSGIGALRVITPNGVSPLSLFMIDPLPSAAPELRNNSVETAQTLELPVAVNGSVPELESRYYTFVGRAGQRVSLEVVAQRLGSLLDPHLRLIDERGRPLIAVEDTPGLGTDCALTYKISRNGVYGIELRDSKYEGGPKHRFRLRVGTFPLTPLPFLDDAIPGELLNAAVPVLNQTEEREPNDATGNAQLISIPIRISGGFGKPGDGDWYEFDVDQNERLLVRGRTRSLGSPCDLFLRIQDTNGNKVAEANVSGADEGSITNTFKKAGRYRLRVEELNQQGGPALKYRIEFSRFRPGFALSTEAETLIAPPGGSFEVPVKPARSGYDGPITLNVVGLDSGFSVTNNIITAKTNETKLRITVPFDIRPGALWQFVIVGRAEIEGTVVEVRTSTAPALRKLFPQMVFPPEALDGLIGLGVSAPPNKGTATDQSSGGGNGH